MFTITFRSNTHPPSSGTTTVKIVTAIEAWAFVERLMKSGNAVEITSPSMSWHDLRALAEKEAS